MIIMSVMRGGRPCLPPYEASGVDCISLSHVSTLFVLPFGVPFPGMASYRSNILSFERFGLLFDEKNCSNRCSLTSVSIVGVVSRHG